MSRAAAKSAAPRSAARQRAAAPAPATAASRLSGGSPLPLTTRQRMERSFGRSFSDVQVHTGGPAGSLASSHGAQAFTAGRQIAFAPGHFAPGTARGDGLIAHELAHVVQQDGGAPSVQGRGGVSDSSEPAEQDAEAASARVMRGEPARIAAGGHAASTRNRLMRRAMAASAPLPITEGTPTGDEDAQAMEAAAE